MSDVTPEALNLLALIAHDPPGLDCDDFLANRNDIAALAEAQLIQRCARPIGVDRWYPTPAGNAAVALLRKPLVVSVQGQQRKRDP